MLERIKRWFAGNRMAEMIDEFLRMGDSRAAVVISCTPLRVAAYTDELDCVAVLAFPPEFVERFGLTEGARVLAVNVYWRDSRIAPDLTPGPGAHKRWQNFSPLIADFLSEDRDRIEERKSKIAESEWERCLALGRLAVHDRPGSVRDGSPFALFKPAS